VILGGSQKSGLRDGDPIAIKIR